MIRTWKEQAISFLTITVGSTIVSSAFHYLHSPIAIGLSVGCVMTATYGLGRLYGRWWRK